MTWFTRFQTPQAPGFRVLAGREDGLTRLLVASGRVARGDHGTVHLHAGDEILQIVSGELAVRVGDQQQRCRAGDIAIIPPNTWHGFHALSDTVIEVVAEQAKRVALPRTLAPEILRFMVARRLVVGNDRCGRVPDVGVATPQRIARSGDGLSRWLGPARGRRRTRS